MRESRPRPRWWRRAWDRFTTVLDVLDLVGTLVTLVRVVTFPFRMLARLLDASW